MKNLYLDCPACVENRANQLKGMTFAKLWEQMAQPSLNTGGKGKKHRIAEAAFCHLGATYHSSVPLKDLGLTLKVSGVRKKKNGDYACKERLSFGFIPYQGMAKTFEESDIAKTLSSVLVMFTNSEDTDMMKHRIMGSRYLQFSEEEWETIEKDWNLIKKKVEKGEAHLLSEGDTTILGACTKGRNATSLVSQPNSPKLAMTRAFSIRTSYLQDIVRNVGYEVTKGKNHACVDLVPGKVS